MHDSVCTSKRIRQQLSRDYSQTKMERIVPHVAAITLPGWIRLHHTLTLQKKKQKILWGADVLKSTKTRENFRTKQNFSSGMGNLSLLSSMFSTGQFLKEKSDRFSTNSLQSFQIKSSNLVLLAFSLYIKRWSLSCRNRLFFSPLRFQTGDKHNKMITDVCKFQLAGKWSETCPANYAKGWKEKRWK